MAHPDFNRDRIKTATALADSPRSCPACTSDSIVSTTKIPNANSYWRCLACGEVWSPARRMSHHTERWRR
jgi:predicted Zn finger-like uncharacterized protein